MTVAGNKRHNVLHGLFFNSEDRANIVCNLLVTRNTKSRLYTALCKRCGIIIAAFESASTAVYTRKTFADALFERILFNRKQTREY